MKLTLKARDWHTWVAVILSVPLVLVGLTAIFLAHGRALGLNTVPVAADWLPGYAAGGGKARPPELRAFARDATGTAWIATKVGLFRADGERLQRVDGLPAGEIRQLLADGDGVLAAGKAGLWRVRAGGVSPLADGELWVIAREPDGRLLIADREHGWQESRDDGRQWQPATALNTPLATFAEKAPAAVQEPLTLARLVIDLHTGKAFLGKSGEWLWIDLVGLTLTLLGLTGIYMWWRGQRRQAALANAAAVPTAAAAES